MLAVDLDGTLLNSQGRVSPENLAAIGRAQQAGLIVVPCTGRAWRESQILREVFTTIELGVFVGGAVVSRIDTGQSLDLATIEPNLALSVIRLIEHLPEAVLVFRESSLCGHDYLVTGRGTLTPSTQWWFEVTGATVHFQSDVAADDLHHTLRVGLVASWGRVEPVGREILASFGARVFVQSFEAVNHMNADNSIHILEVFAAGVDKWRGLTWVAGQHGVTADQIVAIGDQTNDLTMLQSAGCSIAMSNGAEAVKRVAKYTTLNCDRHGVAHAIDQVLAGRWE